MRYVHFDSLGGASGDMILGSLISIGANADELAVAVERLLPGEAVRVVTAPAQDRGLTGVRATVQAAESSGAWPDAEPEPPHGHPDRRGAGHAHGHRGAGHAHGHSPASSGGHAPHRSLADIEHILAASALPARTRDLALVVFRNLAAAEARIHGKTMDTIHFHEVGAADAIADIAGSCLALEKLGIAGVSVGPLPRGTGTLRCRHGLMPNPAPATLELLKGMVIEATEEPFELVTPTGAALLATWTQLLPPPPARTAVLATGFGFGRHVLQGRPNVLRATLLETAAALPAGPEELVVLETNLDDCNPQWLGDLLGRLLAQGGLDAWLTPIVMKKGRPGHLLGVLCEPAAAEALRRLIFQATPTFGIRSHMVSRAALQRRHDTVATPYGAIRMKIGALEGRDITATPEFEDCAAAATRSGVTPRQVAEAAIKRLKVEG